MKSKKDNKIENEHKIWEAIYNVAVKMTDNKNDKDYKILKKGDKTVICFNRKDGLEYEIPTVEYEKIKDGLEKDKYEPEKMGQSMKDWMIDYKVRSLKDKDVVGICHRCDLVVKVGEGLIMLNSNKNIILHRKCFEIDKDHYKWILLKDKD